jgi:periplasmic protein TonB
VNSSKSPSGPESRSAVLQACLVEGDPAQRIREHRLRRRALILSIALQTAALACAVLIPTFGKPGHVALTNVMPLPPYHPLRSPVPIIEARPIIPVTSRPSSCVFCSPRANPHAPPIGITTTGAPEALEPFPSTGLNLPGVDSRFSSSSPTAGERRVKPRTLHVTSLSSAMLIHRVEPIYPTLARQMHHPGRVELRAIIAIDGTVESLQVVTGDPLFFQSALGAVRQWRYTPTILDGQPVEVDTYITVTYVLN